MFNPLAKIARPVSYFKAWRSKPPFVCDAFRDKYPDAQIMEAISGVRYMNDCPYQSYDVIVDMGESTRVYSYLTNGWTCVTAEN